MTNRKIEYGVIPPEADGEFAANMEEVLETYAKPDDRSRPVVCMDEQPVQSIKEARTPVEATMKHPRRVDYEYERAGTANIFMFTGPLSRWREATAREFKTKIDWALKMGRLRDGRYKRCDKVVLVCDNLNTHTPKARSKQHSNPREHANLSAALNSAKHPSTGVGRISRRTNLVQ